MLHERAVGVVSHVFCWISLVSLLISVGCAENNSGQQKRATPVAVTLPPTPSLDPIVLPTVTESGSYTVHGLLGESGPSFGTGVRLEGVVLETSSCVVQNGETLCPPPFLTLVDGLDNPNQAVLVILPKEEQNTYQEGERAIFSGTFQQWSDDKFYVRSSGLLMVATPEIGPGGG